MKCRYYNPYDNSFPRKDGVEDWSNANALIVKRFNLTTGLKLTVNVAHILL